MSNKIKILHIISDSNFGGAGRLLLNLSECIDKNKFEFTFAVPNNSRLVERLKKEGSVLSFSGKADTSFDVASVASICKIIRKIKPDIIHTHSSLSGKIAAKICTPKSHSTVYTKHCVFEPSSLYKRNICRKIYRIVDNLLSEKIIAVADSAKQELVFKGISPSKITVIINGSLPLAEASEAQKSLTRRRLNISDNDFIVGIVARLEEYKGHKTFIEAAAASKKDGENIKFLIIGDGSIKKELVKYAKSLDVTDRVIFTGFVENVSELINILDLNVNCSTGTETSCLAISEGASIGIPAVVSNYGGNPNMVLNGKTGYIYPQKNANELYKIIKSLKNSPKIIKKMKFNIKNDYIQRFSALKMAKLYEDFYINLNKERILSKKRSKTR